MRDRIDRFFKITQSGSTVQTEMFSGLTAYFTMVYILFIVPNTIMGAFPEAFDEAGEIIGSAILSNGLTAEQMLVSLTVAACIAAAIGTFLTAFRTNLPFAQGPSLAISTFAAYTICSRMGYTYEQALAAVFISGIVFFLITVFGMEKKINDAIPQNLKFAVTAGIGLFIAFVGMQKAHIVVGESHHLVQLVQMKDFSDYNTKSALLCLLGLVVIAVMLFKHIHGAILIGKIICIVVAIPLGLVHSSTINLSNFDPSVLSTAFRMDFVGLFTAKGGGGFVFGALIPVFVIIASLCVMNIFETMGTIIATDHILDHNRDGSVKEKIKKTLECDAIATSIGACLGMTTVGTYVESTAMAIEGGRTGFSGVITGILFVVTIFIAPLASVVPSAATATTLIISGVLMMNVVKYINFEDVEEALPAFLTMLMMPLTYSIVTGIALGLVTHTLIKFLSGHHKKVTRETYILTGIFILQFFMLK